MDQSHAPIRSTGRLANRALRRMLDDDPGAWWVTCFAVDPTHRSIGVATALLESAVARVPIRWGRWPEAPRLLVCFGVDVAESHQKRA